MLELPPMNENDTDYSKYNQREINSIFISYCIFGELDKIKIMFNSDNFSHAPDMHFRNDDPFTKLLLGQQLEIIDYLIFEQNMKKTPQIEKLLNEVKNESTEIIRNKFILRDVNKSLNADLPANQVKARKSKV
jgi:hypothetical protein